MGSQSSQVRRLLFEQYLLLWRKYHPRSRNRMFLLPLPVRSTIYLHHMTAANHCSRSLDHLDKLSGTIFDGGPPSRDIYLGKKFHKQYCSTKEWYMFHVLPFRVENFLQLHFDLLRCRAYLRSMSIQWDNTMLGSHQGRKIIVQERDLHLDHSIVLEQS
jgi:hypothetical protein